MDITLDGPRLERRRLGILFERYDINSKQQC